MSKRKSRYHGHRFPPQVISHAIWLYHRFSLSFLDTASRSHGLLANLQRFGRRARTQACSSAAAAR